MCQLWPWQGCQPFLGSRLSAMKRMMLPMSKPYLNSLKMDTNLLISFNHIHGVQKTNYAVIHGQNTSKWYNSVVTKYEVLRSSKLRQFTPSDIQPRSLAAFFGRRTSLIPRVWTACSCSSAGSSKCFISDSREDFTSNKAPLILKSSLRERCCYWSIPKHLNKGNVVEKKHCIHWSLESVRLQETWKVARKVVNPAFVPRNSSNSSFLDFFGDQCRSTWSKWPPNYELILKTDSHTLILYQHLTIKSIHKLQI